MIAVHVRRASVPSGQPMKRIGKIRAETGRLSDGFAPTTGMPLRSKSTRGWAHVAFVRPAGEMVISEKRDAGNTKREPGKSSATAASAANLELPEDFAPMHLAGPSKRQISLRKRSLKSKARSGNP
jgi:hypothetical protein